MTATRCYSGFVLGFLCWLSSPSSAESPPRPVDFWHVGSYEEAQLLKNLAKRFRQETGISVDVQPVPWGHFQTKYFTAMAAGLPPDVGTTNLSGPADFGSKGALLDLERHFPAATKRLKASTFASLWPILREGPHLYGIPYNATTLVGLYRTDVFSQLNLKPPSTWSQLVDVIETLNAHGYPYGFGWTRNEPWALGTYTQPFGSEGIRANEPAMDWTSPGFRNGYTFAVDLWNSYNLVSEKAIEQFAVADPRSALPLHFSYDADYMTLLTRAPHLRGHFSVFPFPHADGRKATTTVGGRAIVIFRESRRPRAAMKWIEYLLSTESQLYQYRFLKNQGERSALALSINRDFWKHDLGLPAGDQARFFQVYRELATSRYYPWAREPQRLLEKSFYMVKNEARRHLESEAKRLDVSIETLKQKYARGELSQSHDAYQAHLAQVVQQTLAELEPQANHLLRRDYSEYKRTRVTTSPSDSFTVLDIAEATGVMLALLLCLAVILRKSARRSWLAYTFVAPALATAVVFTFIPVGISLYLSFTRYNPVAPLSWIQWVGLENYVRVLSDATLWQSLWRSTYFALFLLPSQLIAGVALAACLDRKLIPDRLYKFIYFSPMVTSIVSVALIWFALFAGTHYGWVNALLLDVGLIRDPIEFLKDARTFLDCALLLAIWQGVPFFILVFLAGLQSVPQAQYEAAAIDGAGPLRQFIHISLPSLKPQIVFLSVIGTIGAVQIFEPIYMLGGGADETGSKFGPNDSGLTMVPFLYRKGFEFLKMGEASAIAYVLFFVLALLTFFHLKATLRGQDG